MKVAIIPARGGSKRIPGKNLRPFNGKPIIAYSIEAALASGCFERVLVSTDAAEIAEVALAEGAEVPFLRPASLADDFTGTTDVVAHAIGQLREQGAAPALVCCVYATAPFLEPEDLRQGLERLERAPDKRFAFSVTSFPFPIRRSLRLVGEGVEPMFPEDVPKRSQDLEPAFHDAGQFYWGRASAFEERLPMFAPHSIPIVLPRYRVQDIDTLEDWARAELLHRAIQLTREGHRAGGDPG